MIIGYNDNHATLVSVLLEQGKEWSRIDQGRKKDSRSKWVPYQILQEACNHP